MFFHVLKPMSES